LGALVIHPVIRLMHGTGTAVGTIIIFLYVLSTLHIVWVPIIAFVGSAMSGTRVQVTYQYAVYPGGESAGWARTHSETYFKDSQPEKDGTVRTPDHAEYGPPKPRVPENESTWPKPTRVESTALRPEWSWAAAALSLGYYLSNSWYLARGLSVVHKITAQRLFALALWGPVMVAVSLVGLAILLFAAALAVGALRS
jgi:hypothetical protein